MSCKLNLQLVACAWAGKDRGRVGEISGANCVGEEGKMVFYSSKLWILLTSNPHTWNIHLFIMYVGWEEEWYCWEQL